MKVIQNPDAATLAFQTCEVEFLPDMIRWANVRKLTLEGNLMLASLGYHYCYIAFNCRDYVPDDAGQPDAGRPLAPLNWTDFRQALVWSGLSHDEKTSAIVQIYGGPIVTATDSPVPPSLGIWHWEPPYYPGCNYTYAWELLEASGFYIFEGLLYQPNGVVVRDEIEVLSPAGTPTSNAFTQKWVDKWNDFFGNYLAVTNCVFVHNMVDFGGELVPRAFTYRNFDAYFLCWSLGRFPDYLYDFFHSSQDFPDSNNAPGLRDPVLDHLLEIVKWGTVYEEKIEAAYEAQRLLVFEDCPTVELYSRTYFNAFKNYYNYTGGASTKALVNGVNQYGAGADNGWTWNLMHWNDAPTGGTVKYVLGSALVHLHPGWATSAYEWDVLNRLFDGMLGTDLVMADTPGCACSWSVEPFVWEPLNVYEGQKVRFQLREGLLWHDLTPVTVNDIQFALSFLPNFPRYQPIWDYLLWSQIVDPCTIDIYLNTTSQWILYDLAGVSLLFPEHMYGPSGWLVAHGYNPVNAAVDTITYTVGEAKKALIGCGPFVFDYYDPGTTIAHVIKFQHYWVNSPVKVYIAQPQVVDPCETFEYYVIVFNLGTKDVLTGELTPFVIDHIDLTEDGIVVDTIYGPMPLEPFQWITFGPFTAHFDKGPHYLDAHVYESGVPEPIDSYNCPIWATLKMDVTLDFYIGIDDIFAAASAFGSQPPPFPGYERWDERCDINGDFYVGIDDIFSIAVEFGWDA
jgi:ABC-type transport system substrate-binding protein